MAGLVSIPYQRLAIAHELGHALTGLYALSKEDYPPGDTTYHIPILELLPDTFAHLALMPLQTFRQAMMIFPLPEIVAIFGVPVGDILISFLSHLTVPAFALMTHLDKGTLAGYLTAPSDLDVSLTRHGNLKFQSTPILMPVDHVTDLSGVTCLVDRKGCITLAHLGDSAVQHMSTYLAFNQIEKRTAEAIQSRTTRIQRSRHMFRWTIEGDKIVIHEADPTSFIEFTYPVSLQYMLEWDKVEIAVTVAIEDREDRFWRYWIEPAMKRGAVPDCFVPPEYIAYDYWEGFSFCGWLNQLRDLVSLPAKEYEKECGPGPKGLRPVLAPPPMPD